MRKMESFVKLCLLPELWSLKFQKWLIFCILCWWQQKICDSVGKAFKCIWKMLFNSFREWIIRLWATINKIPTLENTRLRHILLTQQFFDTFTRDKSRMVTPQPINHAKYHVHWKLLYLPTEFLHGCHLQWNN